MMEQTLNSWLHIRLDALFWLSRSVSSGMQLGSLYVQRVVKDTIGRASDFSAGVFNHRRHA